eukprot:scaffold185462_cov54-Attheya_sp.AAC.3
MVLVAVSSVVVTMCTNTATNTTQESHPKCNHSDRTVAFPPSPEGGTAGAATSDKQTLPFGLFDQE